MKRAIAVTLVLSSTAVFSLASALASSGSLRAHTAAKTHVSFSKWIVYVVRHGSEVGHTISPGGTMHRCASQELVRFRAYFRATGPSSGADTETWKVNGKLRDIFHDTSMGKSGYFGVFNVQHGLPDGKWTLSITYGGKAVGHTAVTVVKKKHC